MKNIKPLIYGVLSAAAFSLVLCEIIQGLIAYAAGASGLSFKLGGIKLYADYNLNAGAVPSGIILLLPYLITLAVITSSIRMLKRIEAGSYRNSLIAFSLVVSGFFIFDLFYSAFSIILKFNFGNDWVRLVSLMNLSETGGIIFIFFIIIFSMGYLNLLLKRIMTYINI